MPEFTYIDPTGGGDDIVMTTPEWVRRVPSSITVRDVNGEGHIFEREDD